MSITISGMPGSGKSTVAELLKDKLGLRYVYSGMIFRETAKKYNMSLEEFGKYCEKNSKIDKELDDRQLEILRKGGVILEGRLSGWLAHRNKIPAFKVSLVADLDTRAQRIVKREEGSIEKGKKRYWKGREVNFYVIKNITKSISKIIPFMTLLLIPKIELRKIL